jgi:hypothetical protein
MVAAKHATNGGSFGYRYLFDGVALPNRQIALHEYSTLDGTLYASAGTQLNAVKTSTNAILIAVVFNGNNSQVWTNGVLFTNGVAGSAVSIGDTIGSRYTIQSSFHGNILWFQRCANAGTDLTNMWLYCSNRFNLQ